MRPVIVACDMLTAYGPGSDACWQGILSGRTAIAPVNRFRTEAFQSGVAGIVPGLVYHGTESLVLQMLRKLFAAAGNLIPGDARLMLASTKGEIDLLEMDMLEGRGDGSSCTMDKLLPKLEEITGARGGSMVVSAACTSSSAAAARAAALVKDGASDCVLVVACDSVTEFIYSGFSSLMALDKVPARPFDGNRAGLSVGEAAAFVLIMSEGRAVRENRQVLGFLSGWGLSDDANHMTGPSRASEGLILAITKALRSAEMSPDRVGFISAHGTGTVYNDAMEMRGFKSVFTEGAVPVYSIKGGIGHTMGAAGLVELIMALRALKERMVPPTVNLRDADADAQGWVSEKGREVDGNRAALMTNSGFSGINTALVITGRTA